MFGCMLLWFYVIFYLFEVESFGPGALVWVGHILPHNLFHPG